MRCASSSVTVPRKGIGRRWNTPLHGSHRQSIRVSLWTPCAPHCPIHVITNDHSVRVISILTYVRLMDVMPKWWFSLTLYDRDIIVISRIVRLSALWPLCSAHTLLANRGSKRTRHTPLAKQKRAGIGPGTMSHDTPSSMSTQTLLHSHFESSILRVWTKKTPECSKQGASMFRWKCVSCRIFPFVHYK